MSNLIHRIRTLKPFVPFVLKCDLFESHGADLHPDPAQEDGDSHCVLSRLLCF